MTILNYYFKLVKSNFLTNTTTGSNVFVTIFSRPRQDSNHRLLILTNFVPYISVKKVNNIIKSNFSSSYQRFFSCKGNMR